MQKRMKRRLKKSLSVFLAILMVVTSMSFNGITAYAEVTEECDHTFEVFEHVDATCTEDGYTEEHCSKCFSSKEETVNFDEYPTIENERDENEKYANNLDKTYTFTSPYENTVAITFTFDSRTQFEQKFDFAYIHDGDGNPIFDNDYYTGESSKKKETYGYTGTTLRGKTFTVYTDSFNVRVTTDSSQNFYGFRISEIKVLTATGYRRTKIPALGHDYSVFVSTTDPTCTEKGYDTYKCSRCDATERQNEVNALGQDYSVFVSTTDPTCTEKGYDTYKCSRCDATERQNEVNSLGHDYSVFVSTTDPTCGEQGYDTYKCSRCDSTEQRNIVDATGNHDYVDDRCTVCGGFVAPVKITAENCESLGLPDSYVDYYAIDSATDLAWVANQVDTDGNTLNCVLTDDIDYTAYSGSEYLIGSNDKGYQGTFDGQFHKITVNINTDYNAALFQKVYNATIKNLYVVGTVKTTAKYASGIVAQIASSDKATIENCISDVNIISDLNGDGTHAGVLALDEGSATTVKNCGFVGSLDDTSDSNNKVTTSCAGIVGWASQNQKIKIENCYVFANFGTSTDYCAVIARNNPTVTNCYYVNDYGTVNQGATKSSADKVESGELTYLLNGSSSTDPKWYQLLTADEYPVPDPSHKVVYFVEANEGNGTEAYYTNSTNPDCVHENLTFVKHVKGDCTTEGYDLYSCDDCNIAVKKNMAIEHSYQFTSNNNGTHAKICSKCSDVKENSTEDCSFGDWTKVDNDTHERVCSVCNGKETEEHKLDFIEKVDGDCTHFEYDLYECNVCHAQVHKNERYVHSFKRTKVVNPTCKKDGYTLYTCENCPETEKRDIVEATGHTYEVINSVEVTCTEDGHRTLKCSDCGKIKEEDIPKLGHKLTEEPVRVDEPTCIKEGTKYFRCERCGEEIGNPAIDTSYFQSAHPYANNLGSSEDEFNPDYYTEGVSCWTYNGSQDVESVDITFSNQTSFESSCDWIKIYDENYSLVYNGYDKSGNDLAGKAIHVEGNSFVIALCSDSSVQNWGFAVDEIKENYGPDYEDIFTIPALNHDFKDGVCTRCHILEHAAKVSYKDEENQTVEEGFESFYDAWQYAQGKIATITLYDDADLNGQMYQGGSSLSDITLEFGKYNINGTFELNSGKYTFNGTTGTISSDNQYVLVNERADVTINGGKYVSQNGIAVSSSGNLTINGGEFSGKITSLLLVPNNGSLNNQKTDISGGKFHKGLYGAIISPMGSFSGEEILAPGYVAYKMGKDGSKQDEILVDMSFKGQTIQNDIIVAAHEEHTCNEYGKCTVCGVYDESVTEDTVAIVTIGDKYTTHNTIESAFEAAEGKTATITLINEQTNVISDIVINNEDTNITIVSKEQYLKTVENGGQIIVNNGAIKVSGSLAFNCIELSNGQSLADLCIDGFVVYDNGFNEVDNADAITTSADGYYIYTHKNHSYDAKGVCEKCNASLPIKVTIEVENQNPETYYLKSFNEVSSLSVAQGATVNIQLMEDVICNNSVTFDQSEIKYNIDFGKYTLTCSYFSIEGANVTLDGTTGGIKTMSYGPAVGVMANGSLSINGGVYESIMFDTIYVDTANSVEISGGKFLNSNNGNIINGKGKNISTLLVPGYVLKDSSGNIIDVTNRTQIIANSIGNFVQVVEHTEHSFAYGYCTVCNLLDPAILEETVAVVTIGENTTFYNTMKDAFTAAEGKTATISLLKDVDLAEDILVDNASSNIVLTGNMVELSGSTHVVTVTEGTLSFEGIIAFDCIDFENGQNLKAAVKKPYVLYDENGNVVSDDTITATEGTYYYSDNCKNHIFEKNENNDIVCSACGLKANYSVEPSGEEVYYASTFTEACDMILDNGNNGTITLLDDVTEENTISLTNGMMININLGEHTLTCDSIVFQRGSYTLNATTGGITTSGYIGVSQYAYVAINGGVYKSSGDATIMGMCENLKITNGKFYNVSGNSIIEAVDNTVVGEVIDIGKVFVDNNGTIIDASETTIQLDDVNGYVSVEKHKNHSFEDGVCPVCGAMDESIAYASVTIDDEVEYFDSFVKAINYADGNIATVKLLRDSTEFEGTIGSAEINSGNITIDLNEHTFTYDSAIYVAGGDITFSGNGTIDSSGSSAVNVEPYMSTNITFENGTYISNEDTVEWHNSRGCDGSLIFNNATIEGESDAVYVNNAYNMNITVNGGTFNGIGDQAFDIDNGSSTKKTSIVINGGTFNSLNDDVIDLRYEGIEATINDCIVDSDNDSLYISDVSKLTINGGTFTSESADALDYSCDLEEGQLNITGGTFIADDHGLEYSSSNKANITGGTFSSIYCYNADVGICDLLPTGYVFQNKGGKEFGDTCSDVELDEQVTAIKHLGHNFVDGACIDCGVEGNYKVKVLANGEYTFYDTIEEAIEAVNSIESLESATITLMGDYTAEEILMDSTVDITLDFEGKTVNANQGITVQSGKVTFIGGNIVTQNDAYAVSTIGNAQVMLKSGKYDGISISEGTIGNSLYKGYAVYDEENNMLFDHKSTDKETLETITVKKHDTHNFVDGICDGCELEYVASVSETIEEETVTTVYGSFAEAWKYAQGKTATITLSKNDTVEEYLVSDAENTDITVELGENVLSLGENRFELYQGKFVFNATTGGINSIHAIFDQNNTANLEINGGNYKSKNDMICVGVSDDSTLKISNANLISTKGSVVYSDGGNIEIKDSEMDTDSSIYFYNSVVDITDTEIIGGLNVSNYSILTLNNVDITATNDNTVGIYNGGKVTINGGTHSVTKGSYSALRIDSSDSELNVTDGEFSSAGYYTMAVYAGKVKLTGGTFHSLDEQGAIIIDDSDTYLSDLLGEYCYFETEDGAMVQNVDTINRYSDTIKAVKCQHEDKYVVAGDDVHHYVCEKCGYESEDEACEYEKYGKIYPCETEGADVYKCKVCSNSYKQDFTPQIGHSFTDYVSDNNATCTQDGTKTATCDNGCGKTDTITDEGTALGHEYEEEWYSNDDGTHSKDCIRGDDTITENCEYTSTKDVAPTCTEKGYTLHTCEECGHSYKDAYVDELGHSEGKPVTTKATPAKDGAIVTICTTCNEQVTKVVIPQIKTVTLAQTSFEYDGNAKTPSVTVKDSTGSIIAASNYTVEYKNNIQVGRATVTVTFNSDKYEGTVNKSFEIKYNTTVNNNYINVNAKVKTLNKKIKVSWGKVPSADGYDIFVTSGTKKAKFAKKPTVSVKGNKLKSKTIKKVNGKKLNNSKNYKLNIKAYKLIDGKKVYIGTSYTLYSVGTKNKHFTNVKKIKVKNSKINLTVNKTKKIVVSIVKQNKKKKLISKSIAASYRYWSSNKSVATVNKKGKVTGKSKGTCKVYVMAPNGVKKAVKVTVK